MAVASLVAILLGAFVILFALVRVQSVLSLLGDRQYRRYWQVMATLMGLFFVGYLVAAGIIAAGYRQLFQLLVGGIFLAGAVFVFLVVQVGYLSIRDLVSSEKRLQQRETELERVSEVTDVLNRVLRHNLRNSMNVIIARSEAARQAVDADERHHLDTIERTGSELVELSGKARQIKETIDAEIDRDVVSVTTLVTDAISAIERDYPEATVEQALETEYWSEASPQLVTAIEHLLDNAIRHNDSESPSVAVSVTADSDRVRIEIADDGPGIPEIELDAIRAAAGKPLQHGSGLGLWMVTWIVELNGGEITFGSDESGTTVTVSLPRAPPLQDSDGVAARV